MKTCSCIIFNFALMFLLLDRSEEDILTQVKLMNCCGLKLFILNPVVDFRPYLSHVNSMEDGILLYAEAEAYSCMDRFCLVRTEVL